MNNDEIVSDIITLIHSTTQSNYVVCSQLSSKLFSYLSKIHLKDDQWNEVKKAIDEYEVKQPCVVDNWHTITDRFENKYVPALYLFDADHKMRHFQAGEKAVKMTEPVIQRVLGLTKTV